jgi:hypothetical protein
VEGRLQIALEKDGMSVEKSRVGVTGEDIMALLVTVTAEMMVGMDFRDMTWTSRDVTFTICDQGIEWQS